MRVFSWQWWTTLVVVAVAGCSEVNGPEMKQLELDGRVEPWVSNTYGGGGGICDAQNDNDSPTLVPAVHACFLAFGKALGLTGATLGLCAAEAKGARTASAAVGKWGGCLAGFVASIESWGNWLDATQVDGYLDWSEREIRDRVREATFARCACGYRGQ